MTTNFLTVGIASLAMSGLLARLGCKGACLITLVISAFTLVTGIAL
jgi:hypothetical protein